MALNRVAVATVAAACLAAAHAFDGTIKFTGQLTNSTCAVATSSPSGSDATATDQEGADIPSGSAAGGGQAQISVSACVAGTTTTAFFDPASLAASQGSILVPLTGDGAKVLPTVLFERAGISGGDTGNTQGTYSIVYQ